VVTAAGAIELMHLVTLVHDGLLNNAPMRRGAPTVNANGGALEVIRR
jgi:heptaprenyl diphosphate synthase